MKGEHPKIGCSHYEIKASYNIIVSFSFSYK